MKLAVLKRTFARERLEISIHVTWITCMHGRHTGSEIRHHTAPSYSPASAAAPVASTRRGTRSARLVVEDVCLWVQEQVWRPRAVFREEGFFLGHGGMT